MKTLLARITYLAFCLMMFTINIFAQDIDQRFEQSIRLDSKIVKVIDGQWKYFEDDIKLSNGIQAKWAGSPMPMGNSKATFDITGYDRFITYAAIWAEFPGKAILSVDVDGKTIWSATMQTGDKPNLITALLRGHKTLTLNRMQLVGDSGNFIEPRLIQKILPDEDNYLLCNANLNIKSDVSEGILTYTNLESPQKTLKSAKKLGYDIIGMSDQDTGITKADWTLSGWLCEESERNQKDYPLALRGFEWSYCATPEDEKTAEHITIFGTNTILVAKNGPKTRNGAKASIYEWLKKSCQSFVLDETSMADGYGDIPVAQFDHIWTGTNFNDFAGWDAELDKIFCLAEIGNESNPDVEKNQEYFNSALVNGWHVAPSFGVDNHSKLDEKALKNQISIYTTGMTRDELMDALRARRLYATQDRYFALKFCARPELDDSWYWMGKRGVVIQPGKGIAFEILGQNNKMLKSIVSADIISPTNVDPIYSIVTAETNEIKYSKDNPLVIPWVKIQAITPTERGERCVYLRIKQKDGSYIFSAPIWFSEGEVKKAVQLIPSGDAKFIGNTLRLTPSEEWKCGSAWSSAKLPVRKGFEISFEVQLTQRGGENGGGDGPIFVIQNNTNKPRDDRRGWYSDYAESSFVISFNTFHGLGPGVDYIAVMVVNNNKSIDNVDSVIAATIKLPSFSDGNLHKVKISYKPGLLRVYLDNPTVPVITTPLLLHDRIPLDGEKAWVGMVGVTGTAYENHDVTKFTFREKDN
ncbi:MAG: hypothetical protein WCO98_15930 [bacterium]